jgi:hypothetical protein
MNVYTTSTHCADWNSERVLVETTSTSKDIRAELIKYVLMSTFQDNW